MEAKRTFLCLSILLSCLFSQAQEMKKRHLQRLEDLGIAYKYEYQDDLKINEELHRLLHLDSQRKARNTVGASLLSVGIGGLVGGYALLRTKNYAGEDSVLYQSLGAGSMVVGAAGIGTSIPLFIGAKKSRKKRDRLRALYAEGVPEDISLQQK